MHRLKIEPAERGVHIFLDDFELQFVTNYRLENIDTDSAEFTVTVIISNANVFVDDGRNNLCSNAGQTAQG